ncbi:hypothetical protein Barb4_04019 [Bacteroidales bacterium Barb4]|nr:hypothetical protein Barb4_04019 [Bacteroidales bacterium Barb4]
MVTDGAKDIQYQKARWPRLVTLFGMFTVIKLSQDSKACRPMLFTEFGIETDLIRSLSKKACAAISTTLYVLLAYLTVGGITTE